MARRQSRRSSSPATSTGTPKSKYAAVSKAEVFGAVNYLNRAGRYLVLINSVEEGTNHNNVPFVQSNMTIVKVFDNGPESYDYDNRKNGEPRAMESHKLGEEVVDKIMSNNQVFASNVKRLAMNVGDLTQEDFDKESHEGQIIEEMVSEANPFGGRIVEVRAIQVIKAPSRTKDEEDITGKDVYTRVDYVEWLEGEDITEELDAETIERFSIQVELDTDEAAEDEIPL